MIIFNYVCSEEPFIVKSVHRKVLEILISDRKNSIMLEILNNKKTAYLKYKLNH